MRSAASFAARGWELERPIDNRPAGCQPGCQPAPQESSGLERYLEYGAVTTRKAALVGCAIKQSAGWAHDHTIGAAAVVAGKDGHGVQGQGRARGRRRPQHVDHAATRIRFRETGETG